jgi:hypothetical protein
MLLTWFPMRRRSETVRLRCLQEGLARILGAPIFSAALLQHALTGTSSQGPAKVSCQHGISACCAVCFCYSRADDALITRMRLVANCDASALLPGAETVGDCSPSLPSGGACMNMAFSGAADCTSTTCLDGVLSPGLCAGIACACCAV